MYNHRALDPTASQPRDTNQETQEHRLQRTNHFCPSPRRATEKHATQMNKHVSNVHRLQSPEAAGRIKPRAKSNKANKSWTPRPWPKSEGGGTPEQEGPEDAGF